MAAVKASEKQAVCRKLMTVMKKRYGGSVPKQNLPVLETMLHACCLENTTWNAADKAYENLLDGFFDMNEIRVSSVSEVEAALGSIDEAEWRALRIRSCLLHIFEKNYAFEFEGLKRKTLDAAIKQLNRIKNLSSFVRLHTLQMTMGSHVVPIDDKMCDVAIWLGFVDPKANTVKASESLKSAVKKSDVPLFCYLMRGVATDTKLKHAFSHARELAPEEGYDLMTSADRLGKIFKTPPRAPRIKKEPEKKASTSKSTRTVTAKKPTKKKKAAAKAAPKKKASAKKKEAGVKKKTVKKKTVKKKTTKKKTTGSKSKSKKRK